mmetsp:Transcript_10027/g.13647  ORF Transcript_10027/g.13647 Transcript_10027/m.13647 type:complete len:236 (-) Transcript_10027:387-1094(-)
MLVQGICLQSLAHSVNQPLHMSGKGSKSTKRKWRLNTAGITNLHNAIEAWLEWGGPVCGEEAKEHPLHLQLLQPHALVSRHLFPVLFQELSQGRPGRLGINVREHVGGAVRGPGACWKRLPKYLALVVDWLAGINDVTGGIVLEASRAGPHRQAHPIRLHPPAKLLDNWAEVSHAIQKEAPAQGPLAFFPTQSKLDAICVHIYLVQTAVLDQNTSAGKEALLGFLDKSGWLDSQI